MLIDALPVWRQDHGGSFGDSCREIFSRVLQFRLMPDVWLDRQGSVDKYKHVECHKKLQKWRVRVEDRLKTTSH